MISNLFPTARLPRDARFIEQRVDAHRRLGNDVEVVALQPTPSPTLTSVLAAAGRGPSTVSQPGFVALPVRIPSLSYARQRLPEFPGRPLWERAAQALGQLVDLSGFDVIHAHGMYLVPAGALARHLSEATGLPYAVTVHGGDINASMSRHPQAYADVLDGAGAVAYVSSALRERAHALGARGENATVIPNGVDCDLFSPARAVSGRSTHRRGPRIAFVGHLSSVKGADWLPDIFHGIARRIPDASFVVVGEGSLQGSIEAATRDLSVELRGNIPQEQVAAVLSEVDLAVLPSRSEGWPCVVLEAHASGTPMLGSDAGGIPEAIGDPRFVVAGGGDFTGRFADTAVRALRGELIPGSLRPRALDHDWLSIAARETAMLRRIARRSIHGSDLLARHPGWTALLSPPAPDGPPPMEITRAQPAGEADPHDSRGVS